MKDCELLIKNAVVVTPAASESADVAIAGGKIAAVGGSASEFSPEQVVNAEGLHLLPGIIDSQVHFRQPGFTHKETIASGSMAALCGGVTTFLEMPNTSPATTSEEALTEKLRIAAEESWANYGFFVGATANNAEKLGELERLPGMAGVKLFMGSSTGELLVSDNETITKVLRSCRRRIAIHAEDEEILRRNKRKSTHLERRPAEAAAAATKRILALAAGMQKPLHILHISTAEELPLIAATDFVSCEVTPQHLTLTAPDCYERLGAKAQMNPPIREERHRLALWRAIADGVIKTIGSDHAPHTLEEKQSDPPPSGMPGVETILPIMLSHVARGRLNLNKLVELTAHNPAELFSLNGKGRLAGGYDADLLLVDTKATYRLAAAKLHSKCGWTPYEGKLVTGMVKMVFVGGELAAAEGETVGPPRGRQISAR